MPTQIHIKTILEDRILIIPSFFRDEEDSCTGLIEPGKSYVVRDGKKEPRVVVNLGTYTLFVDDKMEVSEAERLLIGDLIFSFQDTNGNFVSFHEIQDAQPLEV
jgi:hypothetical protein